MTIPNAFRRLKRNRPAMVAAYDITPIRRFQCLPAKPVHGLYKLCTEKAYQFTARAKEASAPLFSFHTGHTVGDELLGLLGSALPPLETWEVSVAGPSTAGADRGAAAPAIHPFNASLLRLLNLFFLRYEFDPTKPSGQMFADINRSPGIAQEHCAQALNTVLVRHGITSADLVAWLTSQVKGAKIRPYNFTMLHNHLTALAAPPATIAIGSPY